MATPETPQKRLDTVRHDWEEDQTWPPEDQARRWERLKNLRIRYRNDRKELIQSNIGIEISQTRVEIFTPVPWFRELCRFSAGMLFPETPRIIFTGHETTVNRLVQVNDFGAMCIEGGINAATEGRVALRVIRDDEVSKDTPLMTLIPEDQVFWDIRHGSFYLGGIVIIERRKARKKNPSTRLPWPANSRVDQSDDDVFRLLEQHTPGLVERFLYKGDGQKLGKIVPLTSLAEFAELQPTVETNLDKATLIPWLNVPGAESDGMGLESLFDAANEAESLLVDRGRKAIPHVFVDRSLADDQGRLDVDGYILVGKRSMLPPLGTKTTDLIQMNDPHFWSTEHIAWNNHLAQLIVTVAGYSPETWGIQGQTASITRAVSGYAMKLSQLRTLLNRSAKAHMALQALGWVTATSLAWMEKTKDVASMLPTIEFGDGIPSDPFQNAQESLWLRQAMAASTETLIKDLHPNWTPEEVEAEAGRIMEEAAAMAPPPAAGGQGASGQLRNGLGPTAGSIRAQRQKATGGGQDPRAGAGVDPVPDVDPS